MSGCQSSRQKTQGLVEAGLQGNRGIDATRALSRALHGIPIDWNESAKWSEELAVGTGKNLPQNYAYYADPANKTVFTPRGRCLASSSRLPSRRC